MGWIFEGERTREISFPLGGIGTGCIGLAGNGRLVDWEIFNHPDKGRSNGFSHFAVKAETGGRLIDARILQGDLPPPYTGQPGHAKYGGYGFGPPRETLAGLPHFRDSRFEASFPFAVLRFDDPHFPGEVTLSGFNPFIPMNDLDSSLPVALFEIGFTNPLEMPVTFRACFSVGNPFPDARNAPRILEGGLAALTFSGEPGKSSDPDGPGDLTVATDATSASHQTHWHRGAWFENLDVFWQDFRRAGPLADRRYETSGSHSNPFGIPDTGSLCASVEAGPGSAVRVRFVLGWSFPHYRNTWNPPATGDCGCGNGKGPCSEEESPAKDRWMNHYATRFTDSSDSVRYAFAHWDRLERDSRRFSDAIHRSMLPDPVADAVISNLATLRTPTCLRLPDGSFYGFEGCHSHEGCCEGSCTHVWNYAYALPFLFPRLERSMRDLDFAWNQDENGGMAFRLLLPAGRERWKHRPCADGQFGGVVKAYRDWLVSGDDAWMRKLWPAVRRSLEYAWHPGNEDRWDPARTGVLSGRQHHTLDMELFGPNAWLTGMYLAALKAGAALADAMGEADLAEEYRRIFARGKAWTDRNLYNGEYYVQRIDLRDRSVLDGPAATDPGVYGAYWSEEAGELKYQIGDGCAVDQLLGQWHANLCGLGEIFDPAQARSAMMAIHRHDFKREMREFPNPCRMFALQDEGGTIICEWPDETKRPRFPVTYAQECMNGMEYAAASLLVQSGLVEEGVEMVRAVRRRYDGERRNPWGEFECGGNYARSMASYALLLAFSGFSYDLSAGIVGFSPVSTPFRSFWAVGEAWGEFEQDEASATIRVLYGNLRIGALRLPSLARRARSVQGNGALLSYRAQDDLLVLDAPVTIGPDGTIDVKGDRTSNP